MKVWVTMHRSGGQGACIDFATVMKNVVEIANSRRVSLDEMDGSEEQGWITLGESYSAVLVEVEGS